jgi:hypothetical protein
MGLAAAFCVTYGGYSWYRIHGGQVPLVPVTPKSAGAVNGNILCELPDHSERVLIGRFALCPPEAQIRVRASTPAHAWNWVTFVHGAAGAKCQIAHHQQVPNELDVEFRPLIDHQQPGLHSGWLVWSNEPLRGANVERACSELFDTARADKGLTLFSPVCQKLGTNCAVYPFSWEVTNREP